MSRFRVHLLPLLAVLAAVMAFAAPSAALEEKAVDKDNVAACEKRLCTMILKKPAKGEDLQCTLAKTWGSQSMKSGAQATTVAWKFGDARCSLPLKVKRENIVSALTKPEFAFEPGEHVVECQVEEGRGIETVHIVVAPRIDFKHGEAKKVWLNVTKVKGPVALQAMIMTVAGLEDSIGLFHRAMIKSVNEFVQHKCAEKYSGTQPGDAAKPTN